MIGQQFHGFMSLPSEIRTMIYDLLLTKGKIFISGRASGTGKTLLSCHEYDVKGYRRHRYFDINTYRDGNITGGLIRGVSKTVQREACTVVYTKNCFVLPPELQRFPLGTFTHQMTRSAFGDFAHLPVYCPLWLIRDLSLTFDGQHLDIDPLAWDEMWMRAEEAPHMHPGLTSSVATERIMAVHHLKWMALRGIWIPVLQDLRYLKLRRLQIDFERCGCIDRCCSRTLDVCAEIGPFLHGFPTTFQVTGVGSSEMDEVRRTISTRNSVSTSRIEFPPKPMCIRWKPGRDEPFPPEFANVDIVQRQAMLAERGTPFTYNITSQEMAHG